MVDSSEVETRRGVPSTYGVTSFYIKRGLPQQSVYTNMPKDTLLSFCRTDGTSSVWPKCGRLSDDVALDHLSSSDEYVVKFLEKLADHLASLLNYTGV